MPKTSGVPTKTTATSIAASELRHHKAYLDRIRYDIALATRAELELLKIKVEEVAQRQLFYDQRIWKLEHPSKTPTMEHSGRYEAPLLFHGNDFDARRLAKSSKDPDARASKPGFPVSTDNNADVMFMQSRVTCVPGYVYPDMGRAAATDRGPTSADRKHTSPDNQHTRQSNCIRPAARNSVELHRKESDIRPTRVAITTETLVSTGQTHSSLHRGYTSDRGHDADKQIHQQIDPFTFNMAQSNENAAYSRPYLSATNTAQAFMELHSFNDSPLPAAFSDETVHEQCDHGEPEVHNARG
jgi:hypothetical protein